MINFIFSTLNEWLYRSAIDAVVQLLRGALGG